MYRHIHEDYVENGVELLFELSRASSDAVRAASHIELKTYNDRLARELREYIVEVAYPPPIQLIAEGRLMRDRKKHAS